MGEGEGGGKGREEDRALGMERIANIEWKVKHRESKIVRVREKRERERERNEEGEGK
jgi:hypothetical protein